MEPFATDYDETMMGLALEEARAAGAAGEMPIGAVVVYLPTDQPNRTKPQVITQTHNLRDPLAHDELSAVQATARANGVKPQVVDQCRYLHDPSAHDELLAMQTAASVDETKPRVVDQCHYDSSVCDEVVAVRAADLPDGVKPRVIARAHNLRETLRDPSAHAELLAVRAAAWALGTWRMTGCTVYVTLEPCVMCAGLLWQARVDRCVWGAADPKGGALGTLYTINDDQRLNHRYPVTGGVRADECAALLQEFFAARRRRPS